MDTNRAIRIIKDMSYEVKMPENRIGRDYKPFMREYSYTMWAYGECIRALEMSDGSDPIYILEGLIERVRKYSRVCNPIIFDVGSAVMNDVINVIYCAN